jgi:hypothetical protein
MPTICSCLAGDDAGRFSLKDVVVGVRSDGIAFVTVGVCGYASGVTDDGVGYDVLPGYDVVLKDGVDIGVEVGMP